LRVFGRDVEHLTVLVQGAGGVGRTLVELLGDAGAALLVSDLDAERARDAAARAGGRVVEAGRAIESECDVYAPCALGGTLNEETIPRLRCHVVAGSANNQLATVGDADRLAARGILYAPDFVINAGGVLHGVGLELLGWGNEELAKRLEAIGSTLLEVYERAERGGANTEVAARRLADERLAATAGAI
jgi:leucine dehydrogenase